ncbi:MAG: SDR family oxidoreductase [Bacteroidales bacterium]|nr:MAG: SDR family oxidoreductase [Bacteroidales bacterium]
MNTLKDKRILITGASSGIGKALACSLAAKGADLILSSRNLEKLRIVSDTIKSDPATKHEPYIVSCDMSKTDEIKNLFNECTRNQGKIDILINNAGIGVYGESDLTTMEDHKSIMEVNYFGAVQCMQEVLPQMMKRKEGMIVNICSVAALHGVPYLGAYGASKAALVALSQSMRAELSKFGISLLVVYPGYTETDFFTNEKKVGNAFRPKRPYTPVQKVANEIIRSIENNKKELVLTLEGKALAITRAFLPGLVRKVMKKMAYNLTV